MNWFYLCDACHPNEHNDCTQITFIIINHSIGINIPLWYYMIYYYAIKRYAPLTYERTQLEVMFRWIHIHPMKTPLTIFEWLLVPFLLLHHKRNALWLISILIGKVILIWSLNWRVRDLLTLFLFVCALLCQTHIVLCFCFDCPRLVSCVWWYPTHIVLCFCFDCFRLVICVHTVTFLGLSILECPWNMSVENYTSLTSPLFNWNSSWNKEKKCVVICLCSMGYRFCMFLRFFY